MTSIVTMLISLSLLASACAQASQARAASGTAGPAVGPGDTSQSITITRSGSQPSSQGSAEYFTGSVRVDPLFPARAPSRTSAGHVTFEPGARAAWHTHPLGQTLIVTSGIGRIQRWGGPVEEIRPGDVVSIPPGVKHWHGASPTTGMTHIAIQEEADGTNVEWMEHVTDEQYGAPVQAQLSGAASARPGQAKVTPSAKPAPRAGDLGMVAPALEKYAEGPLGELWKRPDLTPRDRSIVTLAALIARDQTSEMPRHVDLALDHGVRPGEISELVTHLAFYSGWANAMSAADVVQEVFARRNVPADQLPPASPSLLPLDEAAEAQRASRVGEQFGRVAPGLVEYTTDVLFRDLWLRPGLAPRDRSLATVSALIASGQVAQVPYHLGRAMDNGLTPAQAGEVITHLAFYAGWPNAFSALPVAKDVVEKRPR
jgi:4-carboxymuconolactone decarboxylase